MTCLFIENRKVLWESSQAGTTARATEAEHGVLGGLIAYDGWKGLGSWLRYCTVRLSCSDLDPRWFIQSFSTTLQAPEGTGRI